MSGAPDGELQARLAALEAENAGLRAELAAANVRAVEQKRAEAALAESEGRLRALTSNFPAGAIYQMTASPDGERRFLYVSESVENFGGLTAAELMADATLAYRQLEPEFLPQVIAAEAASMRDHSVFDEEVRFRRRDGQLRWARIVSRPRPQPDGGCGRGRPAVRYHRAEGGRAAPARAERDLGRAGRRARGRARRGA
jgi:PAS domain S-box-containing protein